MGDPSHALPASHCSAANAARTKSQAFSTAQTMLHSRCAQCSHSLAPRRRPMQQTPNFFLPKTVCGQGASTAHPDSPGRPPTRGFFFRYSSSDNVRILVAFLEFCRSFCPNQGALSQNLPDTCSWLEKPYSIMVQRGKYCLLLPNVKRRAVRHNDAVLTYVPTY